MPICNFTKIPSATYYRVLNVKITLELKGKVTAAVDVHYDQSKPTDQQWDGDVVGQAKIRFDMGAELSTGDDAIAELVAAAVLRSEASASFNKSGATIDYSALGDLVVKFKLEYTDYSVPGNPKDVIVLGE